MNRYTFINLFLVFLFFLTFISLLPAVADKEGDKQPSDIYLEYLATAQKANSFDEVAPYWSGWMVDSVKGKSEEEKNKRLQRMKESAAKKKDITVVGSEKSGEFWVIDLKATEPDGQKMKGRVKLIQEKGKYVIEEEYWTGDLD